MTIQETPPSIAAGSRNRRIFQWTVPELNVIRSMRKRAIPTKQITAALNALKIGPPRTEAAVTARIGMLEGTRTAPRPVESMTPRTRRPCMCCHQKFWSVGNHNRLCVKCNTLASRLSPLHPADISAREAFA